VPHLSLSNCTYKLFSPVALFFTWSHQNLCKLRLPRSPTRYLRMYHDVTKVKRGRNQLGTRGIKRSMQNYVLLGWYGCVMYS
jgi:hypothetical protein